MRTNRSNRYSPGARRQNPTVRWQTVLTILLTGAVLLGGSGPLVFAQTIPHLFTTDVLPSDSDVTETEGAVLEQGHGNLNCSSSHRPWVNWKHVSRMERLTNTSASNPKLPVT